MKKRKDLYLKCNPYICYEESIEEVFKKNNSDIKDIVFMQTHGSGVVIRDFWSYYYKIKDTTIYELYEKVEDKNDFLIVGESVIVNMKYVDTITPCFVQVSEHLIPIDKKIKENLYSYQALVYQTKEKHDKICDTAEESSNDNDKKWWNRGGDNLFNNWGSS